jgi:N-acetylglucosamine-6-phosphate deacetylase
MSTDFVLAGADIFDGSNWHRGKALHVRDGVIAGVVGPGQLPEGVPLIHLGGGRLSAGFVDLQVNGGGGVLFNEQPDVAGLETLCAAHFPFGTTALLPTLITDNRDITRTARAAGIAAQEQGVRGFAGLHLEGPHLSLARKGAHDPALIRSMDDADLEALIAARAQLPTLLSTVAVESVTPAQIAMLAEAGITVSLGHTDAGAAQALAAFEAGATMVTHLFNAMSQLGNREPGVVGAAIADGRVWAGLIADGIHVDPVAIGIALRAKKGPAKVFLVTDAMSTIGTQMTHFSLNGREIVRKDRALRLADGTLAGADLTMIDAITFMHRQIGLPLDEVLRMASLYPAQAIGREREMGQLTKGARADIVHLSETLDVLSVWIGGNKIV